jgi:hypothetical protein
MIGGRFSLEKRMKNIPDLILEEEQPTFFVKKGKTSKWLSL